MKLIRWKILTVAALALCVGVGTTSANNKKATPGLGIASATMEMKGSTNFHITLATETPAPTDFIVNTATNSPPAETIETAILTNTIPAVSGSGSSTREVQATARSGSQGRAFATTQGTAYAPLLL